MGVTQWVECLPANRKVRGRIPSQGTCLGCRPGPQWGGVRRNQSMYLSQNFTLSLSLLSPLSKYIKSLRGKKIKNRIKYSHALHKDILVNKRLMYVDDTGVLY